VNIGFPIFRMFIPLALGLVLSPVTRLDAQTLQEAVGSAMAGNPKILAAVNDHLAWDQRVDQAFSGFLPRVDVNAGTGREWVSSPTTRAIEGGYALDRGELGLSVSQSLFEGFNTVNNLKQAKAKSRSAEAGLQKTTLKVILEAVEVYLEALKQGALLRVDDDAIATLEQVVAKMEELTTIGVGTDIEANQSRSRLVMARSDRATTLKKLREAEVRFKEVIGVAPENLLLPVMERELLPESLDAALNVALRHSPALQGSEADLEAAEAEKKMAFANLLPKVNLEMDLGNNANISGTRSYTKNASAMLQLQYNLFRGGNDWARHRETSKRVYQSQEELEQARRQIIKEVSSTWNDVMNSVEQVPLMEKNLAVREHIATAYQEEQALGTRSHLDALNALNDVFSARRSLVTEQFKQIYSTCELFSNMGVLTDVLPKFSTGSPSMVARNAMDVASMVFDVHEALAARSISAADAASQPTDSTEEPMLLDYVAQLETRDQPALLPYAIQVGGLLEESATGNLVEKLTAKGYELFIQESRDSQGRIWQRVWVGGYPTREAAEVALNQFSERESLPAFVTTTAFPQSSTHLSISRVKPSSKNVAMEPDETIFLGMSLEPVGKK